MKIKLLKRIIKKNKLIDVWQDTTLRLLPCVNINFIKCNYKWNLFECRVGWLFWSVVYFGDYKPCYYATDEEVKVWMDNYSNISWNRENKGD